MTAYTSMEEDAIFVLRTEYVISVTHLKHIYHKYFIMIRQGISLDNSGEYLEIPYRWIPATGVMPRANLDGLELGAVKRDHIGAILG